jgi:diguanylate cyclase (GGDEF)-like protein
VSGATDTEQGNPVNATGTAALLHEQVEEARAELTRLHEDVLEAEERVVATHAAQLLEANQELVVSTVRVQTHADACAAQLEVASRSAEIDVLTELPNRLLLLDRFEHAIGNAKRHGSRVALLFLDIDKFKEINDTLGHAVGDEVLKRVAQCLTSSVRDVDTVSRHGGDEFLILLAEVSQVADAALVADKVIAALAGPHRLGERTISLEASIGISIYPEDGEEAGELIDRADAAMYLAKKQGLGSVVFHGQQPVGEASSRPPESHRAPLTHHEPATGEQERRLAQLLEANEHLVLAAIGAQEGQEAAEEAQRQQTEFLAVLAHELRNPLAPIRTMVALLDEVGIDQPVLPRVRAVIARQVMHMSRLVDDLLDASRIKSGKLRIERQLVDMTVILEEAVDSCRPAMNLRRQQLSVDIPPCSIQVQGDRVRLTQIVSNLLDNASKYTPGGGEIGLSVALLDAEVVVTVSDNGIGIAADALPAVFGPFVQDPRAIGFNGTGLGLGLTVVRELVEGHGGSVVATSAGLGLGSRFVVTLPLSGRPLAGKAEESDSIDA